jgi:hypothetical protein
MRKNKYNNKPTLKDGIRFQSAKEAKRYAELQLMLKAGVIKNLKLQPRFKLQDGFTTANGEKIQAIFYIADYMYDDIERDETAVEDVKGYKTSVFKLKQKLFMHKYPQYVFKLT